ncbi:MAG: hypothetical protein AAB432_02485, partial [Patescibacteria group bacterium]
TSTVAGSNILTSLNGGTVTINVTTTPSFTSIITTGSSTISNLNFSVATGTSASIGNIIYDSSGITPAAALTIGAIGQNINIQGATTTIIATSGNPIAFYTNGLERFRVASSGVIQINTTATSSGQLTIIGSTAATSGVAGIYQESLINPGAGISGTFQFGNRHIIRVNPTASTSADGEFIRTIDNTTLNNTVRAMEVQAWSGTNIQGINTGIWTAGRTFGIQAITNGTAGGVSQPAAIYGENTTSTQGQVMRLYSSAIASSGQDFAQFYQEVSNFAGNGLNMKFGNTGGTFTGNFLKFSNGATTTFAVNATGTVMIGTSTAYGVSQLVVCAQGNCTLPTATNTVAVFASDDGTQSGRSISARGSINGGLADIGEYVPISGNLNDYEPGDLLAIDSTTSTAFRKSSLTYDFGLAGVVTKSSAFIAGNEVTDMSRAVIMTLAGRVPVKVTAENGPIMPGDVITASSKPGYGMKATIPGRVLGLALEFFGATSTEATSTIMVFVNPHFSFPNVTESIQGGVNGAEAVNVFTFDPKLTINIGTLVAGKIIVKDLTVGSAEEPTGVTLFDVKTKQPYCLVIEDGLPKSYPGECVGNPFGNDLTSSANSEPPTSGGGGSTGGDEPPASGGDSGSTPSSDIGVVSSTETTTTESGSVTTPPETTFSPPDSPPASELAPTEPVITEPVITEPAPASELPPTQ